MATQTSTAGRVFLALAYGAASACIAGFGYAFYLMLAQAQETEWTIPFLVGGLAALAGIGFTFGAVLTRTTVAGEHILFHTWFPLFMGLVPLAGPCCGAEWGPPPSPPAAGPPDGPVTTKPRV